MVPPNDLPANSISVGALDFAFSFRNQTSSASDLNVLKPLESFLRTKGEKLKLLAAPSRRLPQTIPKTA